MRRARRGGAGPPPLALPPPAGRQALPVPGPRPPRGPPPPPPPRPATDCSLRIAASDDYGFALRTAPQRFSTVAALPGILISEVMASGVAGEYVELLNFEPGAADGEDLALQGPDGIVRPVLATPAPVQLLLPPGSRALAVGASFDAA